MDGAGNAYVTGYTLSSESSFPLKVGPSLSPYNIFPAGFVAKVKAEAGIAGHPACTTFELIELGEDRDPPAPR